MKNKKSIFLATILLISGISPFFAVALAKEPTTSQSDTNSFTYAWGNILTHWDPSILTANELTQMSRACLEGLVWIDMYGNLREQLATSWTSYARPDEISSLGQNSGGLKAISFNLRQGVNFQDGSEWNATVAKWNIDRLINISGYVNTQWKSMHWFDPASSEPRFTENWNLSWYKSDPFGIGNFMPRINETIVVSNYVLNVTFNDWTTDLSYMSMRMISMESYYPWTNEPIIGWGNDPAFPQDNPAIFPGHLIGTGPYKFEFADPIVTQTVKATKNMDYWNKTALEAVGLFSITDVYVRMFADEGARTNALLAGEIDCTSHMLQKALTDLPAVYADPLLNVYPTIFDPSIDTVTILNQEGLDAPITSGPFTGQTPREMFPDNFATNIGQPNGTELPTGVNRTVRRALSYAYDYETYANVSYATGVGIITTSPFGMGSAYYDPSVPYPYYDLTIARQILLDDPYYAPKLASRGLSLANDTATWKAVGLGADPIWTYSMLLATTSLKAPFVEEALNSLGFALTTRFVLNMWTEWVATGKAVMYDMFSYIWINDATNPLQWMPLLYKTTSRRVPHNLYNYAHLANDTIDGWFANVAFQGGSARQDTYNKMADSMMNYHAVWLYCGQYQFTVIANKGWVIAPESLSYPGPVAIGINYAWIGGAKAGATPPSPPPDIPGFMVELMMLSMTIAFIGIALKIMRKRK